MEDLNFTPIGASDDASALLLDLDWVQRLAYRICSNHADAEDLRQEAILALLERREPAPRDRRAWLAGVARLSWRAKRRSAGRREAREQEIAGVRSLDAEDGAEVVARAETQRAVAAAVLDLHEPYRTTLLRRYFDEWSSKEIAERTGTPIDTVSSRLNRGLGLLEAKLNRTLRSDGELNGVLFALAPLAAAEARRRAAHAAVRSSVFGTGLGVAAMVGLLALAAVALISLFSRLGAVEPEVEPIGVVAKQEAVAGGTEDGAVHRPRTAAGPAMDEPSAPAAAPLLATEGRLVDDVGADIEGANVTLLDGSGSLAGSTRSSATGRFELRVSPRPNETYELRFAAGPMVRSTSLLFGLTSDADRLPLIAGVRDLGTVTLKRAGVVTGRVLDERGAPVRGARVTSILGSNAETDDTGLFRIERVAAGDDTLTVLEGQRPATDHPIHVVAGREVDAGTIRLGAPVFLRGVVRTVAGEPVSEARVILAPEFGDPDSSATTDASGRFAVPFLSDAECYLRVDADGYELWDSEIEEDLFAPGTGDVFLRLSSASPIEMVVVDAASGEPVERFGWQLWKGCGEDGAQASGDELPAAAEHVGGRVEFTATAGIDELVVSAPGFARYAESVVAGGSMRVELVRSSELTPRTLTGRVLLGGAPVADAYVQVVGGVPMSKSLARISEKAEGSFLPVQVDATLVAVAADGTFEADAPRGPLVRLKFYSHSLGRFESSPQSCTNDASTDLGDIEWRIGGTIQGSVVLPPGVPAKGLVASIGFGKDALQVPLGDGGTFELREVPPGLRTVYISARQGDFEDGVEQEVEVAPNQTTALEIDASGVGVADVELQLVAGSINFADARVLFVEANDRQKVVRVAYCDATGRVKARIPAVGRVTAMVMPSQGELLAHPTHEIGAEPDAVISDVLEFQTGRGELNVVTPEQMPSLGAVQVRLFDDRGRLAQSYELDVEDGAFVDTDRVQSAGQAGGQLILRDALAGRWSVRAEMVWIDSESGRPQRRQLVCDDVVVVR